MRHLYSLFLLCVMCMTACSCSSCSGHYTPKSVEELMITQLTKSDKIPLHPIFGILTDETARPCSEFFNVEAEINRIVSCINEEQVFPGVTVNPEDYYNIECLVITEASPVIAHGEDFNYLPIPIIFMNRIILGYNRVLGMFDPENKTVFIVHNRIDQEAVFRHEMQHVIIDRVSGPETEDHVGVIWDKCEPRRYTPTILGKIFNN